MPQDQPGIPLENALLDPSFLPPRDFYLVASWGYTPAVKFLFQRRSDISAYQVGIALRITAIKSHTGTFEAILQPRSGIAADYTGEALKNAAFNGHTDTVQFLLKRCTDITADHAGQALGKGAGNGRSEIVKSILQLRSDVSANHAAEALLVAIRGSRTSTFTILVNGNYLLSPVRMGPSKGYLFWQHFLY